MSNTTSRVALAVAALALAASSAGVAAASSESTPSVKTCANKKTGALRVANKCTKSEKAYTLGEVGPTGPIGKTGPAGTNGINGTNGTNGANGANGANGVVNGFFDTGNSGNSGTSLPALSTTTGPTVVSLATVKLPAGSYLVSGALVISGGGGAYGCFISGDEPDGKQGGAGQALVLTVASGTNIPVSPQASVTLKTAGTASLACFDETQAGGGSALYPSISAIPVATLTNTTG